MTEPNADGAGVADLKARRKTPAKGPQKSVFTAPPPPGEHSSPLTPPMVRVHPLLFDPREAPIVVESGGVIPDATLDDRYTIAERDFAESFVPENCRTSVSISRWHKGDHVRNDVYAVYLKSIENETAG
jgi:hypothetical protein